MCSSPKGFQTGSKQCPPVFSLEPHGFPGCFVVESAWPHLCLFHTINLRVASSWPTFWMCLLVSSRCHLFNVSLSLPYLLQIELSSGSVINSGHTLRQIHLVGSTLCLLLHPPADTSVRNPAADGGGDRPNSMQQRLPPTSTFHLVVSSINSHRPHLWIHQGLYSKEFLILPSLPQLPVGILETQLSLMSYSDLFTCNTADKAKGRQKA